jgi:hypothetical protein
MTATTDATAPLEESPLALALGMIEAGEARGLEPADLTFLFQHGLINGEQEGIHLRDRGTQTLRALRLYREAGEPKKRQVLPGDPVAHVWSGPGYRVTCWRDNYGKAHVSGTCGKDGDPLMAAAALQAAHELAEQWRAEREAQKKGGAA